jgi:multimeric flavodoxin WrbA
MKIIAINGSPRKKGNTATLCEEFLKGAKSVRPDVETEIINLYELNYECHPGNHETVSI